MKKIYLSVLFIGFLVTSIQAQRSLTLDSCRALALKNNKELRISQEEVQIAALKRKTALTNYYPKVTAMGAYMFLPDEISLLDDTQKQSLPHLGTSLGADFQKAGSLLAHKHPQFAPLLQDVGAIVSQNLVPKLDQIGNSLVQSLDIDTKNLYVGAVNFTQPIFVGGKIRAYDNITNYATQIAENKNRLTTQEVLLQTDQAYWKVVSLSNKKNLADSYLELLTKMESDIDKMIEQGVATKADGLSVKVKVNEAEMKQTKVNNGLNLAKMALCQICGIELNTSITLADEKKESLTLTYISTENNTALAFENRPEIQSLELANLVSEQKVKVERSEFLPQVAFTGNYIITNPSIDDGINNEFQGMWSLGVQISIPIWHWGEGKYKVNIAKSERNIIDYKLEETKEKITLQVNQANFKVNEAKKQLAMTEKNIEKAEENLRYAKLGFKEGMIPSSEVLEAHTTWFDAQSEKIDAQIEVKLSQVELQKALGILTENRINEF
ncbi:outer membrane protein TolC [Balneicella halophila]|uniref:Outer membrane protein TolC n=1 Tax=Balneicella halophila TaxID=1537566 RepID=A0A7L4UR81_BALHA|nr:TolC family protein [Balneicella halophila]PVX51951.1 outer membrane protein TolC [Balneicella halophila]